MSVVSLLGVEVKNNPARFDEPYEFEITFECLEQLQKDLEWKLTYVGSATSNEYDQELDSVLVGPLPIGVNKFQFKADAPNLTRIPNSEIIGVTVILLSCSYDEREFVRVGYYVNNEYTDEALALDPPTKPVIEKVQRQILAEKPRVTRFAIKWDSDESAPPEFPPEQPEADLTADGDQYGIEEEEEEEAEEAEGEGVAAEGEDAAMAGAEDTAGPAADDDAESEAGSEEIDIEDSEDDEEEEGEEGGDDDMEMDEGEAGAASGDKPAQQQPGGAPQQQQPGADVMVH
ncbi:Histone chaperone asf1 [Alternaria incomplexa]|uniref:Histone chaperone asf1 n=1 Tax=Alternaria metachromatica TaxID=283354 RepID=UPI0020C4F958|nr:Histone chaperone asf1 [Alternaria metachromatica]XP_049204288.1 Histone chaperone asf1 [Alternaria ventricosa]XP_051295692.1 Histone chaperone asf1 [Alternaria incomplexa]KAI4634562.1 Histone chaperone asf1 [Alternaria metachromatica]KAI4655728.1 Histone chaperone asf1 [Alternaria ventricosa]KAI4922181.1 Histone chaperone asf1 [Alternaria incomplexa]